MTDIILDWFEYSSIRLISIQLSYILSIDFYFVMILRGHILLQFLLLFFYHVVDQIYRILDLIAILHLFFNFIVLKLLLFQRRLFRIK
jgi:hypothetical protein